MVAGTGRMSSSWGKLTDADRESPSRHDSAADTHMAFQLTPGEMYSRINVSC